MIMMMIMMIMMMMMIIMIIIYNDNDLSGPPIAGWLVDHTGDKEYAFYLSAGLLFTSAVICVAAWLAQKAKERREDRA